METEFTCICCEAQYRRPDHHCPIQPACYEIGHHVDICRRCRKLILNNFEEQLRRKELPAPKLRIEGENA